MTNHDDVAAQLNAATVAPLAGLQKLIGDGPNTKTCGTGFESPDGHCGGGNLHACALTHPHVGHVCECGAHERRLF